MVKHEIINLFPNKPWFLCVCSTSLLKTLCGKEKLLVMSDFSFSLSVLCVPIWVTFCHFHYNLKLSSANSFSLEESKTCRLGKGLTHYQTIPILMHLRYIALKNIVRKGEVASNKQFFFSHNVSFPV